MARPIKSEARVDARGDLIDAAWELFSREGYDATTVEAIIDKVGLSKGAFYYYFSSKEDILDAVVGRMVDEIAMETKSIPSVKSLSPVEKLGRFIENISSWKLANVAIIKKTVEVIYRDENAIIRQKMNRRTVDRLSPILAEIIREGLEEGVFEVEYPEDTGKMIIYLAGAMSEMQMASFMRLGEDPEVLEPILRRAKLYLETIEKIVGAPRGSISAIDRGLVEEFERAIKEKG